MAKMVIIRNFEMPSACCYCDLCEYEYGERFICRITKHVIDGYSKYYNERDVRCPLEEIKMEEEYSNNFEKHCWNCKYRYYSDEYRLKTKCIDCANCGAKMGVKNE